MEKENFVKVSLGTKICIFIIIFLIIILCMVYYRGFIANKNNTIKLIEDNNVPIDDLFGVDYMEIMKRNK